MDVWREDGEKGVHERVRCVGVHERVRCVCVCVCVYERVGVHER